MSAHAKLSPSSASRWLTCTAAPALEATCPEPPASGYAEEGTAAHALAEIMLKGQLGHVKPKSAKDAATKFVKSCKWADAAFEASVAEYVAQVVELVEVYKRGHESVYVDLEQRLDLSEYVPEGFGTADVSIIADDVLHIIDLKFGKGVPVSAEENNQLMLYGLGAFEKYRVVFDIKTVRMGIIQPRLSNTSMYEMESAALRAWGLYQVKPAAQTAYEGAGAYVPSESACRWCKAKAVCRARAEENLALAEQDFFQAPDKLTPEEIAQVLPKSAELVSWATDVAAYALEQARDHGKKFPGYKLVAGRSNRAFSCSPLVVESKLVAAKVENFKTEPALLSLSQLEKLLGKPRFGTLLGEYVIKPEGKPALVAETDKRPELNSVANAEADFAEAPDVLPPSCGGTGIGDFDDDVVID